MERDRLAEARTAQRVKEVAAAEKAALANQRLQDDLARDERDQQQRDYFRAAAAEQQRVHDLQAELAANLLRIARQRSAEDFLPPPGSFICFYYPTPRRPSVAFWQGSGGLTSVRVG